MFGNEKTANILGYAGLIPFIIFSVGCWIPLPYFSDVIQLLITYAAIILSFMGAIYWGVAIANINASANQQSNKHFLVSIIFALTAWLSLLLPEVIALVILQVSFIVLIAYDLKVVKLQGLPDWYMRMRKRLTLIVELCLISALLSVILLK